MSDNVTPLPVIRVERDSFDDLSKLETALNQRDALRLALETIETKAYSGDWTLPTSFALCARAALAKLD